MQDERKPDLGGDDYETLEKRVDEMLEETAEKPAKKPKPNKKVDEISPEATSAPPVNSKKISVIQHEDDAADEKVLKINESGGEKTVEEAAAEAAEKSKIKDDDSKSLDVEETTHQDDSTDSEIDIYDSEEDEEEYVNELENDNQELDKSDSEEPEHEESQEQENDQQPEGEVDSDDAESDASTDDGAEEQDDSLTDKAVDDIVAQESDKLLVAEDAELAAAFTEKKSLKQKIKNAFSGWWNNKKARYGTLAGLIVIVIATFIVPVSRYFVLNSVGIRAALTMTVLDESTTQPLKNVSVSVGTISGKTDKEGKVRLKGLRLGKAKVVVSKRAFAEFSKDITLGWGSNPQGSLNMKPTGTQYTFNVVDFLSDKAIKGVEASSGESSAISDEKGKILLTIDKNNDQDELEVLLKLEGFRDETLKINADTKDAQAVKMVTARKHVFISKRSGKFDIYKVDIDGKNEQLLLAGSGKERDDMVLVPHPTENSLALVSTRDGKYNKDGYLLSGLFIIDLEDGVPTKLTESERVQIVEWVKGRLIYVEITSGASAANPRRHKLMSYDYKNDQTKELAASNYFNDVLVAAGKLYYAPSSAYQSGTSTFFYQIESDGTNRQTILDKEVWNAFRTNYETLTLSVQEKWYEFKLGQSKPFSLSGAPATTINRLYVDSEDGKNSLWVEERDGKGVLLNYDTANKKDSELQKISGLKNPVRWLTNRIVIYRISTPNETADYVMNLDGGAAVKVRDVTNTAGIDSWYYY
ncbi:MAG: hypothetical protein AAB459_02765 [Patescibacteria group bacterium]